MEMEQEEVISPSPSQKLEQTLAIIKPDGITKANKILKLIRTEGFTILQARKVKLTQELASSFYKDISTTSRFKGCVDNLSSGSLLALILQGQSAISRWSQLVGPQSWKERENQKDCLGYQFGAMGREYENAVHASGSPSEAMRELNFFFPELIVEPTLATNLANNYEFENPHPVLTCGLVELMKEKPQDPKKWLADWLIENNPNKKDGSVGSSMDMIEM